METQVSACEPKRPIHASGLAYTVELGTCSRSDYKCLSLLVVSGAKLIPKQKKDPKTPPQDYEDCIGLPNLTLVCSKCMQPYFARDDSNLVKLVDTALKHRSCGMSCNDGIERGRTW